MTKEQENMTKQIARDIRKKAEVYAQDNGIDKSLVGNNLFLSLLVNKIPCTIAFYDEDIVGHCFVVVGDSVLDVTATQFGIREKICIAPRNLNYFHKENRVFYDLSEEFQEYVFDEWNPDMMFLL